MKKIEQYFLGVKNVRSSQLIRLRSEHSSNDRERAGSEAKTRKRAESQLLYRKSYEFNILSISSSLRGMTSGNGYFWIFALTSDRTTF